MKHRVIVEYDYPVEHKTPVKAELTLHGDRVETWNIKSLGQEPIDYKAQYESFSKKAEIVISQLREDRDRLLDVLDKIRAEIEQAADKQFQIAMGVADLNERIMHVRMENAYRHSLNIIDKYKAESEDKGDIRYRRN